MQCMSGLVTMVGYALLQVIWILGLKDWQYVREYMCASHDVLYVHTGVWAKVVIEIITEGCIIISMLASMCM